jgi:methanogenic corrinoid protein MtbC1
MKDTYSPEQVARAFDVSESSLKRWCDRGIIPTVRTAGGHRRIALPDLVSFLRSSARTLVHPELLGLPPVSGVGQQALRRCREHLLRAMLAGDERACRRLAVELFVAGHPMHQLCDEVLAEILNRVGELWECGDAQVYQERLSCEICNRVLDDCRDCLPDPASDAPLALGAAPAGDLYTLPTRMAELVMKEAGWRSLSLGNDLPLETLAAAVCDKQPRLVWLSMSSIADADQFLHDYTRLQQGLPIDVALVVGGRALDESLRRRMTFFAHCDNFTQLAQIARTLRAQTMSEWRVKSDE